MNTLIGYRGKVTIKGSKGKPSKGSKNAGTVNLFTALANVIAKKYNFDTVKDSMPTYIDFRQDNTSVLNSYVLVTTSKVSSDNNLVKVTLRGLVTFAKIDEINQAPLTACLLDANGAILAEAILSDDAKIQLSSVKSDINGQATVEWEMIIGNFDSTASITE